MTRFLLDSDILMDFLKKKREAVELIVKLSKEGWLSASILSVTELRAGWNENQAKFFLPRLYMLVTIENLTLEIAELAGHFRQEYKLKGINLPAIDTLIAATAIVGDWQLVTGNKKDYPMSQLKFYQ
ncbi:type II toxin-antitoxin system VapC family toxin [Candidatus Gottesmanbacteria bacterium]|nr:type II toxin-antitoxin system VapC family toxin [Candidatus Gottesmanbacteria bacterium]